MNLDKIEYSRTRFNFLNLLTQLGGFMGIFRWLFTTFMGAWNTNALDNFMVSKLYKVSETVNSEEKIHELKRSKFPHLKDYLMSWVPTISKCCTKKGKYKA